MLCLASNAYAQQDTAQVPVDLTISGKRSEPLKVGFTDVTIAGEMTMVRSDSVDRAKSDSLRRHDSLMKQMVIISKSEIDNVPREPIKGTDWGQRGIPPPQSYALGHADIDWYRFAGATGALAGAVTALHIYQANAWWNNARTDFHVFDDPDYKDNIDKFGHAFGGYYSAHFFDEAFTWSGFNPLQSAALGATCAALWELYIEVEDGFARDWGFSHGDAIADLVGAGFYFARLNVPYLDNVKYKWMYWPSKQLLESRPDIPGQTQTFIEDYAGQSYWISLNVNGILPEAAKPYWPSWLNVAVGVSDYSLDAPTFEERKKAWLIALDYDLGKLIPESEYRIVNFIRRALDYWHFPAPAMRITPDPRFFILFPFRMSIG